MVGVAGRSKGCATCRRRKVKGYERYAVFLRKGLGGWEKRRPLEETRPSTKQIPKTLTQVLQYEGAESARASPLELKSIAVEAAPFLDYFLRDFICSPDPRTLKQDYIDPGAWIHGLKNVKGSGSLLHNILVAVSMVYCGKTRKDRALLNEGRIWYCRSLCQLHGTLSNDESSRKNEILFSTSVCMAYETIDPSDPKSSIGWLRHFVGMTKILEHRGPMSFGDAQSRDVLEDTRYMVMMSGLMRQRSSFLAGERWMTGPWASTGKNVRQQVADCGLLLGNVFEEMDEALNKSCPSNADNLATLLEKCLLLNKRLGTLELERQEPTVDGPFSTAEMCSSSGTAASSQSSIFEIASNLRLGVTILGIRLRIHEMVHTLALQMDVTGETSHQLPTRAQSKSLAVSTLDVVEQYLALDIGSIAKGRHVFALERAREHFTAGERELSQCDRLLSVVHVDDWDKDYKKNPAKGDAASEEVRERGDLDTWCVMVTSPRR
ncbi:hypothetical protein PRZ48_011457 [Zasmidium cellare]|uniref:Uncharacterized protein n=1 Tax=Zasmidium cellare TaxID=395010 RepID=A0ABR0E7D9_ZASCE|nr:hypothetical protein PRZ48_011457 [Zasmidium cellare]